MKNDLKKEKNNSPEKDVKTPEKDVKKTEISMQSVKNFLYFFGIIGIVLMLDLVTKAVLFDTMTPGDIDSIIPGLFNFTLIKNYGAAWGILSGNTWLLVVMSLFFLGVFVAYYVYEKKKTSLLTVSFALIIAGTLGNMIDRIFLGYVRDFIQFAFWDTFPVFNFADVALCIGMPLFVLYLILTYLNQRKQSKEAAVAANEKVIAFEEKKSEAKKPKDINQEKVSEDKVLSEKSAKKPSASKTKTTKTNSLEEKSENEKTAKKAEKTKVTDKIKEKAKK